VAAETLDSVRGEESVLSERAVARTAVKQYYKTLHEQKDVGKAAYAEYVDDARGDKLAELSPLISEMLSTLLFVEPMPNELALRTSEKRGETTISTRFVD